MCDVGVYVKVIQDTLGHKDISTTLNIYTDVMKELRRSEFEGLDSYFKNEYNKVSSLQVVLYCWLLRAYTSFTSVFTQSRHETNQKYSKVGF